MPGRECFPGGIIEMLITLTAFMAAAQALPIDRTALELQARAEALANQLSGLAVVIDARSEAEWKSALATVGGPIEGAVLTAGGWDGGTPLHEMTDDSVMDKMHAVNERARLLYGAASMFGAAALTWFALKSGTGEFTAFVALFALGWLLQYNFYNCAYPALQDVIEPRLRATAMAVFFAVSYVLGGAIGPVLTGALSDSAAKAAMAAAGATQMTDQFKGVGLHEAMIVVPIALVISGIAMLTPTPDSLATYWVISSSELASVENGHAVFRRFSSA